MPEWKLLYTTGSQAPSSWLNCHIYLVFFSFFVLAGSSSDYGEILLPLLAVMQDLVDSNVLSPSLVLVSFAVFLLRLESSLWGSSLPI